MGAYGAGCGIGSRCRGQFDSKIQREWTLIENRQCKNFFGTRRHGELWENQGTTVTLASISVHGGNREEKK